MRNRVRITGRGLSFSALIAGMVSLSACGEAGGPGVVFGDSRSATRLVERDVEAPEVFSVSDKGIWDGRPSFGGVWVSHADVQGPERVIIRNRKNSKFVIGALFHRANTASGAALQLSSDAAAALDVPAGVPALLEVTALRRAGDGQRRPVEGGEIAISDGGDAVVMAPASELSPRPESPGTLDKPYIQIGIFSVRQNADNSATAMRQNGMRPHVKEQSLKGKTYWRVIVGPAAGEADRVALLNKIREIGFEDAFKVDG